MAKILVIEDDRVVATLVRRFLTDSGHEVTVAKDGKVGLRSAESDPPDLVITDIFMPEKDGLEAIRELKAKRPELPIVAMSGGGAGASAAEILPIARILGAKEVLMKPLSAAQVLAVVDKCLGKGA